MVKLSAGTAPYLSADPRLGSDEITAPEDAGPPLRTVAQVHLSKSFSSNHMPDPARDGQALRFEVMTGAQPERSRQVDVLTFGRYGTMFQCRLLSGELEPAHRHPPLLLLFGADGHHPLH